MDHANFHKEFGTTEFFNSREVNAVDYNNLLIIKHQRESILKSRFS